MFRSRFGAFLLVIAALGPATVAAQNPILGTGSSIRPAPTITADSDAPLPIFNDQVRRFRFPIEHVAVTAETAGEFMVRYQGTDQPEIIGAYSDAETNSLIVVGPPEAEHAIRLSLATWIVKHQEISPSNLKARRREMEFRRRDLLVEMAELEIAMLDTEGDRAEKLGEAFRALDAELTLVEKQLQVVDRYVKRIDQSASESPLDTSISR